MVGGVCIGLTKCDEAFELEVLLSGMCIWEGSVFVSIKVLDGVEENKLVATVFVVTGVLPCPNEKPKLGVPWEAIVSFGTFGWSFIAVLLTTGLATKALLSPEAKVDVLGTLKETVEDALLPMMLD